MHIIRGKIWAKEFLCLLYKSKGSSNESIYNDLADEVAKKAILEYK